MRKRETEMTHWNTELLIKFIKKRGNIELFLLLISLRTIGAQEKMTGMVSRQVRSLSYPDESEMGLFFALAIPLDDPISTKAISVAFFFEANYELPHGEESTGERATRRSIFDRRAIYSILESKFESLGFDGRQCLLRSICETARLRPYSRNGLLGDLLRIVFSPSTSKRENLDEDYERAELMAIESDCASTYSSCPIGIYDGITHEFNDAW